MLRAKILSLAFSCGVAFWGLMPFAVYAQESSPLSDSIFLRDLVAQEDPEQTPEFSSDPAEGKKDLSVTKENKKEGQKEEEREDPWKEPLETDRDSFTPATTTVARHRWIAESSYSFIDNRHSIDTNSLPELLLRYGLTERIELRFGWNYEVGGGGNVVSSIEGEEGLEGAGLERETRALYGLKTRITDKNAWVPQSSLIIQGFTPTSGEATATELSATYVFGWELPRDWKLDAALRYATSSEHDDEFAIWSPSTVLRIPIGERVNVHGEYFAACTQGKADGQPQHFVSPGLHYLVTPDLEIGVRVGWGLNDAAARFFSNVGVGVRF